VDGIDLVKLLRLEETSLRTDMKVFRESALRNLVGLVFVLGLLGVFVGVYIAGELPVWMLVVFGLVFGLIALVALKSFVRSLARTNWVMAIDYDGVRIKITSYLNNHLYKGDVQAVFIPFSEVESAESATQRRTSTSGGRSGHASFTYLDLALRPSDPSDIKRLSAALDKVRNVKASSMFRHFPAYLWEDCLRIEWRSPRTRVTPSPARALRELARHIEVKGSAATGP
jgi:hypothetical protein